MALLREETTKRLHVASGLMGESLVSTSFLKSLEVAPQRRLFPDVNVMKIGGQSICDRGAQVLPGLVEEVAANRHDHKMLLLTGGGTRSRHIYNIGLELGMPTGIIAKFGSTISEQNALMVAMMLGPWGGIEIDQDDIVKLPGYFAQGCIPVTYAMPPYDYFALPPGEARGRIPIHRTDVGTILLADLIGAKSCLFVKDEKGLFADDPKKDPSAAFIPEIGAKTLMEKPQDDMVVERPCMEILQNSEVLSHIQIIDGTKEGNLTRALRGEHVGTIIYKE